MRNDHAFAELFILGAEKFQTERSNSVSQTPAHGCFPLRFLQYENVGGTHAPNTISLARRRLRTVRIVDLAHSPAPDRQNRRFTTLAGTSAGSLTRAGSPRGGSPSAQNIFIRPRGQAPPQQHHIATRPPSKWSALDTTSRVVLPQLRRHSIAFTLPSIADGE